MHHSVDYIIITIKKNERLEYVRPLEKKYTSLIMYIIL